MSYADQFLVILPELILTVGALVLMIVAAWGGQASTRAVSLTAIAVLAGAGIALAGAPSSGVEVFNGLFRGDAFATFAKVLIYIAAGIAILIAPRFFEQTSGDDLKPEYPVLILLSSIGMGVMVSAGDLLSLYVGLELQSLAAYVLASFMRRDQRSAEAGLKYFVLGGLASGILLFGISWLYGFTGSTNFAGIATAFAAGERSVGLLVGLVFVMAGLAFKISAVPFHMWTPDVYEGAPTPVTTFFASAPKVAAVALTVRVAIEAMGPAAADWRQIVIFAALASIIFGAVAAIGQSNIKRLLAYSSINNIGFALIGLAAGTAEGVAAVLVYLSIYVVMTLGSFLIILQMRGADGVMVERIDALAGMSRSRPLLAFALAMFMFSLAGIPPLFGFYGKFVVFDAAVAAGLFPLAVIGIAASVIGAYYYLRVVKTMYFDEPAPAFAPATSRVESGLIAGAAVLISPAGYLLIPVLGAWSFTAARALFLSAIRTVATTGSTNADLLALAKAAVDEVHGCVPSARQPGVGGKDANGYSPEGNLYASTLVRLRPTDMQTASLSLVAGIALHDAVAVHAGDVNGLSLKWPNDLLVKGSKMGGILLERSGDAVVAGFGLNVAQAPEIADRRVTSLHKLGVQVDACELLTTLAECFARWLRRWRGEGGDVIHRSWSERAHPRGTPLGFHDERGGRVEALFDGLTIDGAARLRLADGSLHVMHAGDLFAL